MEKYYTIAEIAQKKLIGLKSYKAVYNKVRGGLLKASWERHPKKSWGTYGFYKITEKAIQDYRVKYWMCANFSNLVDT